MHYGPQMQLLGKASVKLVDENEEKIGAEMRDPVDGMEYWTLVEFGLQITIGGWAIPQVDGEHFCLPVSVKCVRWNGGFERDFGDKKER